MFMKFTPKDIFAVLFLLSLIFVVVWNFPIHNYGKDWEKEYYEYFSSTIMKSGIDHDLEIESLNRRYKKAKDKDYKELLLNRMWSLQPDINKRTEYYKEFLSIDMEHNPNFVATAIYDFSLLGKYDEAFEIAQNTKIAKDDCYKSSATLGQAISCKVNVPYLTFVKDWYANYISCNITGSGCYDTPVYEDFKRTDYYFNRDRLIEYTLDVKKDLENCKYLCKL